MIIKNLKPRYSGPLYLSGDYLKKNKYPYFIGPVITLVLSRCSKIGDSFNIYKNKHTSNLNNPFISKHFSTVITKNTNNNFLF